MQLISTTSAKLPALTTSGSEPATMELTRKLTPPCSLFTGNNAVTIGLLFRTPKGLEDVSKYPNLFAELLQDPTWSEEDLKKLAGLNFLRVFKQVEKVNSIPSIPLLISSILKHTPLPLSLPIRVVHSPATLLLIVLIECNNATLYQVQSSRLIN